MEYVALLKTHAQFSAWYVRVFLGIVIEMRSYMYLEVVKALWYYKCHVIPTLYPRNKAGIAVFY